MMKGVIILVILPALTLYYLALGKAAFRSDRWEEAHPRTWTTDKH